jgi:hypothetical protein
LATLAFFALPLAALAFFALPLAALAFFALPLAALAFFALPLAAGAFAAVSLGERFAFARAWVAVFVAVLRVAIFRSLRVMTQSELPKHSEPAQLSA